MTFSIVARCADSGQFGMAVSSSSPAVAARCAYARAGETAFSAITKPFALKKSICCLESMASPSAEYIRKAIMPA